MMPLKIQKKILAIGLSLILCHAAAFAEPVVVVSSKSNVTSLSSSQVADIFLGKARNFPNGDPAIPLDQAEGSEIRDEFYMRFANKSAAQIRAYWSKIIFTGKGEPPKEAANTERVKKTVSENPSYIGYIDRSAVDPNLKIVAVTKP